MREQIQDRFCQTLALAKNSVSVDEHTWGFSVEIKAPEQWRDPMTALRARHFAKALSEALKSELQRGITLSFTGLDGSTRLEQTLLPALHTKGYAEARRVTVHYTRDELIDVRVEFAEGIDSIDSDRESGIITAVHRLLDVLGLSASHVHLLVSTATLPNDYVVLRMLKIHQPCDIESLASRIRSEGFDVSPLKRFAHQLDRLRQHGLTLYRKSSRQYLLTMKGL